jgi:hypothetical protein
MTGAGVERLTAALQQFSPDALATMKRKLRDHT